MENSTYKDKGRDAGAEDPQTADITAAVQPESTEDGACDPQPSNTHPLPAPEGGEVNTAESTHNEGTKPDDGDKKPFSVLSLEQGLPEELRFFPEGAYIPADTDEATLQKVVSKLETIAKFTTWAYADLVRYSDKKDFTLAKRDVMEATGYSPGRLATLIRVASAFPLATRNPNLTFEHHEVVVSCLPSPPVGDSSLWDKNATGWLRKAEENGWSAKALRERLGGPRQRQRQMTLLGFVPATRIGEKLAIGLRAWLEKSFLNEKDVGFGDDVLGDIEKLKECMITRLRPDSLSDPEPSTPRSVGRLEEAFKAALADVEAGMPFKEVAHKYGLTQRQLGRRRLEEAAKFKDSGMSYAAIYRKLGVKQNKLAEFLRKRNTTTNSPESPDSQITEEAQATPCHTAASTNIKSVPACNKALLSCAAGLESALAAIRSGTKLNEAARQHGVETSCLVAYRRAKAEALFAENGSVSRTATELRMDYKDLRKHLRRRGLAPGKEGN